MNQEEWDEMVRENEAWLKSLECHAPPTKPNWLVHIALLYGIAVCALVWTVTS